MLMDNTPGVLLTCNVHWVLQLIVLMALTSLSAFIGLSEAPYNIRCAGHHLVQVPLSWRFAAVCTLCLACVNV